MVDNEISTQIQVHLAQLEAAVKHISDHYDRLSENMRVQNKEFAAEIKNITTQINDYYYLYEHFKQHSEVRDEALESRIDDLKSSAVKLEQIVHDLELAQTRSVFKQLMKEISDSKVLVIIKWAVWVGLMMLGVDRLRILLDGFIK